MTSVARVNAAASFPERPRTAPHQGTRTLVLAGCLGLAAAALTAGPAQARTNNTGPTNSTTNAAINSTDNSATNANGVARHQVKLTGFSSDAELARGVQWGTTVRNGAVVFNAPHSRAKVDGRTWEMARYATPWVTSSVPFTELIPSWQAKTPAKTAIRVQVRVRSAAGTLSSWDDVALWAVSDRYWKRHTYAAQPDDLGSMSVDTFRVNPATSNASAKAAAAAGGVRSWQLRVDLLRPVGGTAKPSVQRISGVTSALAPATWFPASRPGATANAARALGTVLDVPRYSQMVHRGHYPGWGGGGEAWCSPTSVSMVLGYYGALPAASRRTGVPTTHTDSQVDFAARQTFDHTYDGAGNWAFSTAYAGNRGREVAVTRMRSLTEIEQRIAQGKPVIVSVRFKRGELTGAPISMTNGHLLVVVGFDRAGNVVVNDPAAPSNASVRRTYNRAQFENVWLPASPSGSGGVAYLIL